MLEPARYDRILVVHVWHHLHDREACAASLAARIMDLTLPDQYVVEAQRP